MLDLTQPMKSSSGEALKDENKSTKSLARFLCEYLETSQLQEVSTDDFGRFWKISQGLGKEGKIEIDSVDLRKLSDFVKKSPRMPLLIKAQLDEAISDYQLKLSAKNAENKD